MADAGPAAIVPADPLHRFWLTARGFWGDGTAGIAWGLIALLVACVILQLVVQYRLNLWNRDFFNALEQRNGGEILRQVSLLPLLAAGSVGLGIAAVWGRMTFQRTWRQWLTAHLIGLWLAEDRTRRQDIAEGEHQNAEYRISEDARLATDAPVDLVLGLLTSLLTAATFIVVLWNVGGELSIPVFAGEARFAGYLVAAALLYSLGTTLAMMWVARHMVHVIERKNQAEADLKYALAHTREHVDSQGAAIGPALRTVIRQWRRLCGQHMRTTLVSHGNTLLAPLVGLILCVPNYIRGEMLLGEVTQAAAAFVAVQGACNWLVDNYPRLAEWLSSANRVGSLLSALDEVEAPSPD